MILFQQFQAHVIKLGPDHPPSETRRNSSRRVLPIRCANDCYSLFVEFGSVMQMNFHCKMQKAAREGDVEPVKGGGGTWIINDA